MGMTSGNAYVGLLVFALSFSSLAHAEDTKPTEAMLQRFRQDVRCFQEFSKFPVPQTLFQPASLGKDRAVFTYREKGKNYLYTYDDHGGQIYELPQAPKTRKKKSQKDLKSYRVTFPGGEAIEVQSRPLSLAGRKLTQVRVSRPGKKSKAVAIEPLKKLPFSDARDHFVSRYYWGTLVGVPQEKPKEGERLSISLPSLRGKGLLGVYEWHQDHGAILKKKYGVSPARAEDYRKKLGKACLNGLDPFTFEGAGLTKVSGTLRKMKEVERTAVQEERQDKRAPSEIPHDTDEDGSRVAGAEK